MERSEVYTKLNSIVEEILYLDDLQLTDEMTAKDVENWDSIRNVEIIAEIEEQFDVKFKTLEIEQLKNMGDIVTAIVEKS